MNWYKIAQLVNQDMAQTQSNLGTPNISVRPYEPLVQEAVEQLKSANPSMFTNITDINVDMGYGQLGSVISKSPNSINLNVNKMKDEARKQLGGAFNPGDPQHKAVMLFIIKQTIVHELSHISGFDPKTNEFAPESAAGQAQNEWAKSNLPVA